jgi:hypothetical protein
MLRQVETMEIVATSTSLDQMFDRLLENGALLQLDAAVRPTMYRCCTVTSVELHELQRIPNVIRLGRVRQIGLHYIDLDDATISTSPNTIHVDCTADGLARRPIRPVFEDDLLTLQTVRTCQQVFSAAFIAHVEATYEDEAIKNELCTVVPHPDDTLDWVRTTMENALNSIKWNADPGLKTWLSNARLDGFAGRGAPRQSAGPSGDDLLRRIREATPSALEKLAAYLDEGRKVN